MQTGATDLADPRNGLKCDLLQSAVCFESFLLLLRQGHKLEGDVGKECRQPSPAHAVDT